MPVKVDAVQQRLSDAVEGLADWEYVDNRGRVQSPAADGYCRLYVVVVRASRAVRRSVFKFLHEKLDYGAIGRRRIGS